MNDSKRASEIEGIAERLESAAPGGSIEDELLWAVAEETHAILSEDRDRRETWSGLLEWMDRRWPEDLFPTLTDNPGRDTGPRLTSALRRLAEAEQMLERHGVEWTVQEAVAALDAITGADPEGAHFDADQIVLAFAPESVRAAHERLVERADGWWYA